MGTVGTILCQIVEIILFGTVSRSDAGGIGKIRRKYSHFSFEFYEESLKFARGSLFT